MNPNYIALPNQQNNDWMEGVYNDTPGDLSEQVEMERLRADRS